MMNRHRIPTPDFPWQGKSGVSSSFLPKRRTDTGLREKMNRHRITRPDRGGRVLVRYGIVGENPVRNTVGQGPTPRAGARAERRAPAAKRASTGQGPEASAVAECKSRDPQY